MATPASVRAFEMWTTRYKHMWRSGLSTSLLSPLLFLTAMGLGLGSLVNRGPGADSFGGVRYVSFIAPGLLAAAAIQIAAAESTWPVLGAIKWDRTYHAMLATPLGVADVLLGHLTYMTMRAFLSALSFGVVMTLFGTIHSWWAPLAIPAATLGGVAIAASFTAFAATRDLDSSFAALNRFVIIPMFLFSGTFYPISRLPSLVRPIAYITPLYHSVALCRSFTLGTVAWGAVAVHTGFLAAVAVVAWRVGIVTFRRRLAV
jgi:lipooligosaccharide transport system permease protein